MGLFASMPGDAAIGNGPAMRQSVIGLSPSEDGAELGHERGGQLVAAGELIEHRGRLVAQVGDGRGRGACRSVFFPARPRR